MQVAFEARQDAMTPLASQSASRLPRVHVDLVDLLGDVLVRQARAGQPLHLSPTHHPEIFRALNPYDVRRASIDHAALPGALAEDGLLHEAWCELQAWAAARDLELSWHWSLQPECVHGQWDLWARIRAQSTAVQ